MTDRTPIRGGIESMASYYAHIIQTLQPKGPYDFGGYSIGGAIAYEVTRLLQGLGERVNTLVMLDSMDKEDPENSKANEYASILMVVNTALISTISNQPEKIPTTLIHRDEINFNLNDENCLKHLIRLAKPRGLKKTAKKLQKMIQQMVKVQPSLSMEGFSIKPLADPEAVSCFYFRNKNGRFLGELEPYFNISPGEALSDPTNYWYEWKQNLPNLHIMDVDSPNHMMLLSEPKCRDTILSFCERLYSEKGMSPQFLTAFKKKTQKIHGTMISSETKKKAATKTVKNRDRLKAK